jgi:hypothetical protein
MTKTEARWSERVREWRASGQTAPDFARGRGFEPSTLRYWASRLHRRSAQATPKVRLLRVRRVQRDLAAAEPLVLAIGAARVEVRAGFDRALLRDLVDALGGSR